MAYFFSPFRKKYTAKKQTVCPFCDKKNITKQVIKRQNGRPVENKYYRWLINTYPKFEGHTMIVPKKHITKFGQEKKEEILAREKLVNFASKTLQKLYPNSGIEFFLQTGPGSESSIEHLHWHIVPAMPDDPLRSFAKLGQFYTTKPDQEKVIIFPIKIKRSPQVLKRAITKVL